MHRRNNRIFSLTLIVMLSTLIACFRLAVVVIPNVNPVTALVLIMGIVFGKKKGFLIGVTSTLLSSLVTGFGTWVIFQVIAWGAVGLIGGYLGQRNWTHPIFLAVFGFFLSFFYGWFTNLEIFLFYTQPYSFAKFATLCVGSFYFDFAHAVSTLIILFSTSLVLIKTLNTLKTKYAIS